MYIWNRGRVKKNSHSFEVWNGIFKSVAIKTLNLTQNLNKQGELLSFGMIYSWILTQLVSILCFKAQNLMILSV